ncbi:MAG TPA: ABC transporter substrate-binding protein, partial [Verrucomicrobiae bacterium]|nr:ABC transporter substrate-binding protein [Verrucomicrobiae bacterium]
MTAHRIDDSRAQLRFALALVVAILVSPYAVFTGHAASDSGKLEKTEIVLAYPQPSGVFTPIFVAGEAGLFKKYGLNVKLQQLNPQSSVQAVISGSADMSVAAGDLV